MAGLPQLSIGKIPLLVQVSRQSEYHSLAERLAVCLAGGAGGAGNWLTLDYYEGDVPGFGGVDNIPTHLDAAGTLPGEVYTADVVLLPPDSWRDYRSCYDDHHGQ